MSKVNDFDIANIAESILKTESKDSKKIISTPKGIMKSDAPDISKVKVPETYTSVILENSFGVKSKKPVKKIEAPVIEEEVQEVDLDAYVRRLVTLISEAKSLIDEMTTCGSIGMNMGGYSSKPAKKKLKVKKSRKNYG